MSKAGKGAALSVIGQNMPNIFSSVLDTYSKVKGMKRQEKLDEADAEERKMRMAGYETDNEKKKVDLVVSQLDAKQKTEAYNKLQGILGVFENDEIIKKEVIPNIKKSIAILEPKTSDTPAEAKQKLRDASMLDMTAENPLGAHGDFAKEMADRQVKNQGEIRQGLAQYSQVNPQAKALFEDLTAKEEAEAAGRAAMAKREADVSDMATDQLYKESSAAQKFEYDKELKLMELAAQRARDARVEKNVKKPSSTQYLAAGYTLTMQNAQDEVANLTSGGFDPTTVKARALSKSDLSAIKDPNVKRYAQATLAFTNATLRRESGAAISPTEYTNAQKQYFPQLGDDAGTLRQKEEARIGKLASLRAEAGDAYGDVMSTFETLKAENAEKQKQPAGGGGSDPNERLNKYRTMY